MSSTYRMRKLDGRTVNGRPVRSAVVYEEADFYRWRIRDTYGNEYVDGGNYRQRDEAITGLKAALCNRR